MLYTQLDFTYFIRNYVIRFSEDTLLYDDPRYPLYRLCWCKSYLTSRGGGGQIKQILNYKEAWANFYNNVFRCCVYIAKCYHIISSWLWKCGPTDENKYLEKKINFNFSLSKTNLTKDREYSIFQKTESMCTLFKLISSFDDLLVLRSSFMFLN